MMPPMKYWEIIADRLQAEGWSCGIAEHFTKHGFLFCVDAHRDGKRFVVKADDLLTAFLPLERDAIAAKGANGNATRQRASPRSTLMNREYLIRRYEHNYFRGWVVSTKRRGKRFVRYFSDPALGLAGRS